MSSPSTGLASERANVLRLRALGALRDVELDLLVLVQGLVALRLDGRVVHEDVVAAVLLRNEAETLLGVEPLNGALSHAGKSPYWGERRHFGASSRMRVIRRPASQEKKRRWITNSNHVGVLLELASAGMTLPTHSPLSRGGVRPFGRADSVGASLGVQTGARVRQF